MAVLKDRKLAPAKETWDLDHLLDGRSPQAAVDAVVKEHKRHLKLYEKRFDSLSDFVAYSESSTKLARAEIRISTYLTLKIEENALDAEATKTFGVLSMLLQPFAMALANEEVEAIKNRKKIEGYLRDDRLTPYRRRYEMIFRLEPHVLSEEQSRFYSQIGQAIEKNVEIFSVLNNSEIKFRDALDSKKKGHLVTNSSSMKLLESKDRVLRANTQKSLDEGRSAFKETMSRLVANHFLAKYRLAQAHKFGDHIERSLFADNVDKQLVEGLYKYAKANLQPRRDYLKAYKTYAQKALKIPRYESHDRFVPLIDVKNKFSIAKGIEIVADSVKPLGKDYAETLKTAFTSRWVDFHITPNKRSGAFSAGKWAYDKHYVLTNYADNLYSVFTLAHEMGHSMHSYYTCNANHPEFADHPIFMCEVPSNFCELLVMEYFLQNTDDDRVRFMILNQFITNFDGNVYRQLEYSEFEYDCMKALKADRSIASWEDLSKLFFDAHMRYAPDPEHSKRDRERISQYACYVPHYYYDFYVYKYSIGMIGALNMMAQLKADQFKGAANYVKLISAGTQQWPADILKSVGIDLSKEETYKKAFDLFADYVKEFRRLGDKIFGVKG